MYISEYICIFIRFYKEIILKYYDKFNVFNFIFLIKLKLFSRTLIPFNK